MQKINRGALVMKDTHNSNYKKARMDSGNSFANISTSDKLIKYLEDTDRRLRNSGYLYHYTTLRTVVSMINNNSWHLASAANMNDKLEYDNGNEKKWNNLFFSCFMTEEKESIGMWSMYAQPWEAGVKIAIPKEVVRHWINETKEVQEISVEDYRKTGQTIKIDPNNATLKISAVAYSNVDSLEAKSNQEKLIWSTATNTIIKNATHLEALTGYVKDMAWSYEKETRIKAEFANNNGFKRVAIELTDEVIDSMIITASPLFKGNLQQKLKDEIDRQLRTEESMFSGRLNIRTICQDCSLNTTAG